MDWVAVIKIAGMFLTVIFLGFLVKELVKSAKESNDGRVSDKSELD